MNITKTIAGSIANQLTQKLRDKKSEIENQMSSICRQQAIKKVPESILAMFDGVGKEFIRYESYVRLHGNGFNYDTVYCASFPSAGYETININVTPKLAEILMPLKAAKVDYEKQIRVMENSLFEALMNLRTKKRIEEQFPEAVAYWPEEKQKMEVMVDLNPLRDFAKKQLEEAA